MPLQDFIHKLTAGSGARVVQLVVVLFAMIGLAVWYDVAALRNLPTIEGMDSAQLARNIAEGRGYTTEFIRPLSIHLIKKSRSDADTVLAGSHPDLANAPLYPLLLAGAMKILPAKFEDLEGVQQVTVYGPDVWIAIFNQGLFLVAVWMVFRLGRRLFDEQVAWVSAGVFAGSDLFWRFSASGLSTMLLVVIILGLAEVLTRIEPQTREGATRSAGWLTLMALAAGALAGLAGLTRYGMGLLIVPVAFFLALLPGQRRGVLAAAAVAACVAVMGPWVARNFLAGGAAFGTAGYVICQNTVAFPGFELERTLNPEFSVVEGRMIFGKLFAGVREIMERGLPRLGGSWVSAFFLVGLLVPFRNPVLRGLRSFTVGSLAMLIVVQALARTELSVESPEVNSENLLVVFAPLVFLFGVSLFFVLLDQVGVKVPGFRALMIGGFVLIAAGPLLFTLTSLAPAEPPRHAASPAHIQDKARAVGENDLVMTDIPWAMAWYGHRPSVWLSLAYRDDPGARLRNDFAALHESGRPVRALYLSLRTTRNVEARAMWRWFNRSPDAGEDWEPYVSDWDSFVALGVYLFRQVPTGFPLKQAPFGALPELFLMESERSDDKTIKQQ